ncbi:MAG: BamA/TamA family outer membrane protein [Armatimonadetes bacterium]|nr:BamA/TamA family outer membrane protein [Armatimonadota bacterium]
MNPLFGWRANNLFRGVVLGAVMAVMLSTTPFLQRTLATPQALGVRKIAKIVVTGNKVLNADFIVATSRHKVGDVCDSQTLLEMKASIFGTGLFGFGSDDSSVRVSSQENTNDGTCTVLIDVDENPKIERVEITGSGPIPVQEVDKMVTRTAVYSLSQFQLDFANILDLYRKRGFVAEMGPDPGPKLDDQSVLVVPILVQRVTEIKLLGNKKTKSKAILREMLTKEGSYFNFENLRKDQQKIFNMGIFETVEPVGAPVGVGKISLAITLKEKQSGQVSAGLGFSNRQQLIGFAQLAETNFRGMAETVSLRWETGGITGRSTIELGYIQPWIDQKHTSLNLQLYDKVFVRFANRLNDSAPIGSNTTTQDNRYFEERIGGTVTVGRPFKDNTYRADFSLRADTVKANPLALDSTNSEILQNVQIASVGASFIHDTRDLFLDPVSGYYHSVALQIGHANINPITPSQLTAANQAAFGSSFFVKTLIELRNYIPLAGKRKKLDESKTTLALRTQLGYSAGKLPFSEQFFLGGPESLRGYREDRAWGNKSFLFSAELRHPLARSFTGVLFMDMGSAWGGNYSNVAISGFSQASGFSPRFGFGVGVRVRTPIAPIRIDFGIGSEGGRTYISFGNIF